MLIDDLEVNFKLTLSIPSVYLLEPEEDSKLKIKITDSSLYATEAELSPSIPLAHLKVLSHKWPQGRSSDTLRLVLLPRDQETRRSL